MPPQPKADIDGGKVADWGQTSRDYARYRPGPPVEFYAALAKHGVGLSGQSILDIGTGTGALALEFAIAGCRVTATDVSESQITMAIELANAAGQDIDYQALAAANMPFEANSFDAVTACQCWWYFDHAKTISEIARVLRPGGKLAICFFSFLPMEDPIAGASERLVERHNPNWTSGGWDGERSAEPEILPMESALIERIRFDVDTPFTRESWRGRMRALRGIGASLSPDAVTKFDAEHETILRKMAGNYFTVRHRIEQYIYDGDHLA